MLKVYVTFSMSTKLCSQLIDFGLKFSVEPLYKKNGEIADQVYFEIQCTQEQYDAATQR